MDYWYLLALIYTLGATIYVWQSVRQERSLAKWTLVTGFLLLTAGLVLQILLHFEFQAWAVRAFFWMRGMLALAWLGHAVILLTWPDHRFARPATLGLLGVSLAVLVLLSLTQITEAQGWYDPSAPIYGQMGDLLATNRPTRWGSIALNVYGSLALIGTAGYAFYASLKRSWQLAVRALAVIASATWLLGSLMWPALEATPTFYLGEFATPLLLLWGIAGLYPMREAQK